ncbi:MAG: CHASE2 domain-containing protein, partial [Acidobacteria bacterium Pan2503]|nr:CHASE2 domain-containing protein [Candidatus Acidoferrum panamensis]
MAAPSEGFWQRRGWFGLYELLQSWWRHRISFLLSLSITLVALTSYYLVFLQETRTPLSELAQRLELATLDTRFRYRPARFAHPDPRIAIVDIDQKTQEVLGRWPFSRTYFAQLLDALHADGAAAAAFDITFSKPDQIASPLRSLRASLEAPRQNSEPVDARVIGEINRLVAEYDADAKFAAAIRRFGPVILGNYFLFTPADLQGLSDATLDSYANQISFFAFPPAHPMRPESEKQDKLHLMEDFAAAGLLPRGAEANLDTLTSAMQGDSSWTGFFNFPPDNDGVVRRATLVLPYGRSQNPEQWDLYSSLGLVAARALLGQEAQDTNLFYGPTGIWKISFGSKAAIYPDGRGQ